MHENFVATAVEYSMSIASILDRIVYTETFPLEKQLQLKNKPVRLTNVHKRF